MKYILMRFISNLYMILLFIMSLTIGFLSNKLTLRGTEVAVYDYAHYNELILNNKSIIISRDFNLHENSYDINREAYTKFKNRFIVEYYETQTDIDDIIEKYDISHLYIIKSGENDGLISTKCKTLIHCVFNTQHEHGNVYSTISNDVNTRCGTKYPVVPHMIDVYDTNLDMRKELGIPEDTIVFGRYGGKETFDITFVHECIEHILSVRNDIFFIFMNTYVFYKHDNIKYLEGTTDMLVKRKFINTCDALLHARRSGETFGLTCGEFAICQKPVITYSKSPERNHLDILGNSAVTYDDYDSLFNLINTFTKNKYDMSGNGYMFYTPECVMKIFKEKYLD